MKKQLKAIMKQNPEAALDFYFNNMNKIKGVYYNTGFIDKDFVRILTIDSIDYEIERKELNINPILELC
jgi:hypothetical protein